jgi:hypothetical protein
MREVGEIGERAGSVCGMYSAAATAVSLSEDVG